MNITVIDNEDGFESIKSQWDLLLDAVEHPMPFLSHAWIKAWRDNFEPGAPLYIITVRERETLIAVLPLYKSTCTVLRLFRLSCLTTFINSDSAISNLICRKADIEAALGAIRLHLTDNSSPWDLLLIGYVPFHAGTVDKIANAFTAKGLAVFVEPKGKAFYSYYIEIKDDFETFFKGLGPSFKDDRSKKRNRLLRLGKVELRITKDFNPEEFDAFLNLEDSGWKGLAGTSIKSSKALPGFYAGIAEAFSKNGQFMLAALMVDNKPLACLYAVLFHAVLYPLKIGVDLSKKEFVRVSPGQALLDRLIQYCFRENVKIIDFYGQCYSYESHWTKTMRSRNTIMVFNLNKISVQLCVILKKLQAGFRGLKKESRSEINSFRKLLNGHLAINSKSVIPFNRHITRSSIGEFFGPRVQELLRPIRPLSKAIAASETARKQKE